MSIMDIKDIVQMLTDDLEAICAEILPLGRREGSDWVEASTARGGIGDSLKVCLMGSRRGVFNHFSSGAKGDVLELVAYVMFRGDKKKALAWARSRLRLDNADPKRIKQQRLKASANAKKREAQHQETVEKRKRGARAIWLSAQENIVGSPVDLYLLGRGVGISDLPKLPGSLRFALNLKHPNGKNYPAMVAAIHNAAGEFVAVHRTYLEKAGEALFVKASLAEKTKLVYGPYAGGFITLNRGYSGKKLKDAPPDDHVILCESIEDGLSLALACPHCRVLACVSVGNFQNICLPKAIGEVTFAADNDAPDSAAGKALRAAIDRFCDEGRNVYVARSPIGKDFNDCLTCEEQDRGAA